MSDKKESANDEKMLFSVNARWIALLHTVLGGYSLVVAFVIGVALHFKDLVENELFKYPQEWFPALTLVIGKFFPERALFQIVCAIAAGVRVSLVVIWFVLTKSATSRVPTLIFMAGLLRTAALGGLVYVPVVDDHDTHDLFLTVYLMFTLAWFFGIIHLTDRQSQSRVYRKRVLRWYFVLFIPLVHYFTQHRFYQVPGALSKYSFFEYVLVALDLLFDLVGVIEFEGVEVRVYKGAPGEVLARPTKKFFV